MAQSHSTKVENLLKNLSNPEQITPALIRELKESDTDIQADVCATIHQQFTILLSAIENSPKEQAIDLIKTFIAIGINFALPNPVPLGRYVAFEYEEQTKCNRTVPALHTNELKSLMDDYWQLADKESPKGKKLHDQALSLFSTHNKQLPFVKIIKHITFPEVLISAITRYKADPCDQNRGLALIILTVYNSALAARNEKEFIPPFALEKQLAELAKPATTPCKKSC